MSGQLMTPPCAQDTESLISKTPQYHQSPVDGLTNPFTYNKMLRNLCLNSVAHKNILFEFDH